MWDQSKQAAPSLATVKTGMLLPGMFEAERGPEKPSSSEAAWVSPVLVIINLIGYKATYKGHFLQLKASDKAFGIMFSCHWCREGMRQSWSWSRIKGAVLKEPSRACVPGSLHSPSTNSSHVVLGRGEAGELCKVGERFESAASAPWENVVMALPLCCD